MSSISNTSANPILTVTPANVRRATAALWRPAGRRGRTPLPAGIPLSASHSPYYREIALVLNSSAVAGSAVGRALFRRARAADRSKALMLPSAVRSPKTL